jgi:hypothetical protein
LTVLVVRRNNLDKSQQSELRENGFLTAHRRSHSKGKRADRRGRHPK